MYKPELIEAIAKDAKLSKSEAERALNSFIERTTKALKNGKKVSLIGFGTFSVLKRDARKGTNPQNGKTIKISAKKFAKFKGGAELSKAINKK